mgnify:CR=1 FL=1
MATVEYLVHLPFSTLAHDLCIAEIGIPEISSIRTVEIRTLPRNWVNYPSPGELAEIGEAWKREGSDLVLKVPSVVVKNEWNFLINPSHLSFKNVKILSIEPYVMDGRLVSKKGKR